MKANTPDMTLSIITVLCLVFCVASVSYAVEEVKVQMETKVLSELVEKQEVVSQNGEAAEGGENTEATESSEPEEETVYDIRRKVESAEKDRFELLRLLADIYETTDKKEEAIGMYEKALLMDPSDKELTETLLRLYRDAGKNTRAIPIYEKLVDRYKGNNAEYYQSLVDLYFADGQEDKAFATLERYLAEHNKKIETYTYASQVYSERGKGRESLQVLEKGIENLPDNYDLYRNAARSAVSLAEYSKALEYYETAKALTSLQTNKEKIEKEMMELYDKADILKEVIVKKDKELREIERKLTGLYVKQGEVKEEAGKIAEAISVYRKLSTLAPDTVEGKMAAKRVKELEPRLENN